MIEFLRIKNFKSLKDVPLHLKRLNILAGLNGMGKSSMIQSLLLLRQSYFKGFFNSGLILKGEYIELGTGKDILYQAAGDNDQLIFECIYNDRSFNWNFDYSPEKHVLPMNGDTRCDIASLQDLPLFNNNFQYINAEHISPESLHLKSHLDVVENRQIGIHGEYAVHYLYEFGEKENISFGNLHHPNAKTSLLIDNVDAWLKEISPGIRIRVYDFPDVDYTKLGFDFATSKGYTSEFRPINVGFGLTYILPILVSILSAKPGKLILAENPESHIHPRGQAIIGELLFKAAQNDIQLIVETHSDHILNGIRAAAFRQKSGAENVGLYFFQRSEDLNEHYTEVSEPHLDNNGRIDSWPDGFFDEWEKILIELV